MTRQLAARLAPLVQLIERLVKPAPLRPALRLAVFIPPYVAALTALATRHEYWRDEIRALSIAVHADSIPHLFQILRMEGHPPAWYLLLRAANALWPSPLILPILSIAIASAMAAVLVALGPFSILEIALLLISLPFLHEYSVICRNYGLATVMLFWFCAMYRHRNDRPMLSVAPLILLCVSNTLGNIVAAAWALLLMDGWLQRLTTAPSRRNAARIGAAWTALAGAMAAMTWMLFPRPDSPVTQIRSLDWSRLGAAFGEMIANPSGKFSASFGVSNAWVNVFLIAFALNFLLTRWRLGLVLLTAWMGLGSFFILAYPGYVRHQLLLFILMIAVVWVDRAEPAGRPRGTIGRLASGYRRWIFPIVWLTILADQGFLGLRRARTDWERPFSSSAACARFINSTPAYKDAILLSEPDFMFEALPYYLSNPIYFCRSRAFRSWSAYSRVQNLELTLGELTANAVEMKKTMGRPVLIALVNGIQLENPLKNRYWNGFGTSLTWTPEEVAEFKAQTRRCARFRGSVSWEDYTLFEAVEPAAGNGDESKKNARDRT